MEKKRAGSGSGRPTAYVGIDVQVRRGCSFMVLSAGGGEITSGWAPEDDDPRAVAEALIRELASLSRESGNVLAIGIDAPRRPLPGPRRWYWQRSRNGWRERRPGERGAGRHCEVVISALRLANPQWTPHLASAALPQWMAVGFQLFERFEALGHRVHEVFPSASLSVLEGRPEPRLELSLASFRPGKTDMLDALIAAATVREFEEGRGWEAPGGDGLGTIVLPARPSHDPPDELLSWPRARGR